MKARLTLWLFLATALPVCLSTLHAAEPIFSDANWSSLGDLPTGNSAINAAVVDGSGNLYVGGSFTRLGDVFVSSIAKWDGNAWSPLGLGVAGGSVSALAVSGGDLYVGGSFTSAGGITANYIAKWDGNNWSALGSGMDGTVSALAVSGSDVFAGGNFLNANGIPANRIAKWNGTAWSPLGSGTDANVNALAVSGGILYAGGSFTTAGGVFVNLIGKWNGSTWSALGFGIGGNIASPSVFTLAVSSSNVYAGGQFLTAGGNPANFIAKWNGSTWSTLGSGMGGGGQQAPSVFALAVAGTDLYAGGGLTTAGGSAASRIARWDGTNWSALGMGIGATDQRRRPVLALATSGSSVYVGGEFRWATNSSGTVIPANNIVKWNGNSWSALDNSVSALAVSGSDLYAGGQFLTASGISANHVARWNGNSWSTLGLGLNNGVFALAVSGSDVYVGGNFSMATNGNGAAVGVNSVARWNGSNWRALGLGVNNVVNALAISGSDLYAGGSFTSADGSPGNRIAKWNGTVWSPLGSGMDGPVNALAVSGGDLYAGGSFTTAGGVAANGIARWNGSSWSALGSGMNSDVFAVAVSDGALYAGGHFTMAGGNMASGIAKWNGSSWSALGSGLQNAVSALAVSGCKVYAAGSFTVGGGSPGNRIASWNGSSWSGLGSGMNGDVLALAVSGNYLYAGGLFTTAGAKLSAFTARAYLPVTYSLTTNVTGLGHIILTPEQPCYESNSSVTLTAMPALEWTFDRWSGAVTNSENPLTMVMASNTTLTANFRYTDTNDTPATASRLNSANSMSGAISANGADVDYYSFFATAGDQVWAFVDTGGPQGDFATSRDSVLTLLGSDGVTVIEQDDEDGSGSGGGSVLTGGSSAIASATVLDTGLSYLKVEAYNHSGVINPYTLYLFLTSGPATWPEPNDTPATAIPIVSTNYQMSMVAGDLSSPGDVDYYSVVAEAGNVLQIMADGDPERDGIGTDLRVTLLNTNGTTVLFSANASGVGSAANPPAEAFAYRVPETGTYFVKVEAVSVNGPNTYQLLVNRSAPGSFELRVSDSGSGVVYVEPFTPYNPPYYRSNTLVTLTEVAKVGFQFEGWRFNFGPPTNHQNPLQVLVTGNMSVYASFTSSVPIVIVDNTNATFAGLWSSGSDFDTYGPNYRSAPAQGNPAVAATFTPNLPVAGLYSLRLWLPYAVTGDGGTARYTIAYDGGSTNIDLAQTEDNEGYWFEIFTGRFAAGTGGSVRVTSPVSEPGHSVYADAVGWFAPIASTAQVPPLIRSISRSGPNASLAWFSMTNRTYRVQYKTNLGAASWTDLAGDIFAPGTTASRTDTTLGSATQRFYRVVLLP